MSIGQTPPIPLTGTVVPMGGDFAPVNGCPLPKAVTFRAFAGASGEGVLIEDNGCRPGTPAYRRCQTRLALEEGDGLTLRLLPAEGATELIPAERRVSVELVGVSNALPDEADCGCTADYDGATHTLKLALDVKPGAGATLRWRRRPACPPLDRPAMVHALLLPIRMANADKDRMLEIAQTVTQPERRLASWMTLDLPDGLIGALAELEYVK